MFLSFTSIDKEAKFQDFWYQLSGLEVALDVLSTITQKGDTIIKAHILDEGSRTELPPEAFDGEPLSQSIQQLEAEWKAILSDPLYILAPDNGWQIDLTCKRIKIYDDRIAQFILVVNRFEQLREWADQGYEPQRTKLINHYEATLAVYRNYIDRDRAGQRAAQKRLSQLRS